MVSVRGIHLKDFGRCSRDTEIALIFLFKLENGVMTWKKREREREIIFPVFYYQTILICPIFFLLILCVFLFVCFCFSHYTNTFLRNDQAPIFRLCLPVFFSILRENFWSSDALFQWKQMTQGPISWFDI